MLVNGGQFQTETLPAMRRLKTTYEQRARWLGGRVQLGLSGSGDTEYTLRISGRITPDPVPEPAAWALLIAGFGITGAALRRRAYRIETAQAGR